jgi:SAM-dependent methyltransferase
MTERGKKSSKKRKAEIVSTPEMVSDPVQELAPRILRALRKIEGARILEVGCHDGRLTTEMAQHAGYVVGVSFSDDRWAAAEDRALQSKFDNISFQILESQELPFENESFDCVILHNILQYIPEPKEFLTDIIRIFKSPGKLIAAQTVGSEDAVFREAHAKLVEAREDAPTRVLTPNEVRSLLGDDPLEFVSEELWSLRVGFDQWMPDLQQPESRRDKVRRMLVTAAKKKNTDLQIEVSGKSVSLLQRWILYVTEKTGAA